MKLDRNINADGGGKYALLNTRMLRDVYERSDTFGPRYSPAIEQALETLEREGLIQWGPVGG